MSINSLAAKLALSTLLTGTLFACSNHAPAPVMDLYASSPTNFNQKTGQQQQYYLVKPGDTLFSIAWYHSLDHREIARINNIDNYLIYPGQKLALHSVTAEPYFNANSLILALNQEVLKVPANVPITVNQSPKRYPKLQKQPQNRAVQEKIASEKAQYRAPTPVVSNSVVAQSPSSPHSESKLNFIWPTEGKIIERFSTSNNANRGVDIAAKRGEAVRAAAPGHVVYKGNGLRGYGNLVIIKHDNDYLSAYAHNEKVHVAENEFVKAGQRIADIGSSGAQSDKLHFEIRYKGKPVDPLNYLPQK